MPNLSVERKGMGWRASSEPVVCLWSVRVLYAMASRTGRAFSRVLRLQTYRLIWMPHRMQQANAAALLVGWADLVQADQAWALRYGVPIGDAVVIPGGGGGGRSVPARVAVGSWVYGCWGKRGRYAVDPEGGSPVRPVWVHRERRSRGGAGRGSMAVASGCRDEIRGQAYGLAGSLPLPCIDLLASRHTPPRLRM
jgi:hypothetical protein